MTSYYEQNLKTICSDFVDVLHDIKKIQSENINGKTEVDMAVAKKRVQCKSEVDVKMIYQVMPFKYSRFVINAVRSSLWK